MNFWDSSALLPLLIKEESSTKILNYLFNDQEMIVWWGSYLECMSGLARKEREGTLSLTDFDKAKKRLLTLASQWNEVQPVDQIKEIAERLLRNHDLRAADSMQLASALLFCQHKPNNLTFASLDNKLSLAANREGFAIWKI
jgi:predicted nucleic acid-binding protein